MTVENLNWLTVDSTEDFWWVFYLENAQTVDTLQPLLEELTSVGLRIADTHISDPYFRVILREEEGDMYFELSNPSDDVAPYLFLGTLDEYFVPPDSQEARWRADQFLEFGKVCYRVLRPLYAFAGSMNTHIRREDIEMHRLTHVCWAQFFGPDFVNGFDRDVLINAPAWRNENLGDGGLLYVLAASRYLNQGPRQYWQQARGYFAQHVSDSIQWSDHPG